MHLIWFPGDDYKHRFYYGLINPLTALWTYIWSFANSLDADETPSNSASHPHPSCLTLG